MTDKKPETLEEYAQMTREAAFKAKNRPEDQPMPTTSENSRDVQEALLEMIQQRRELGISRYGSPLKTHNGRDALRDALEEAVDLSAYLMQLTMEEDDRKKERISYQYLLEYVSENFRMTYPVSWNEIDKKHEPVPTLICETHGKVKEWQHPMTEELEMMREIGLHMDLHDHDEWKACHKQ